MNKLNFEERWNQLITHHRIGVEEAEYAPSYRTTFQKDFDRLIFSAAFRRMQDKTQVFPLAQTDYVRTRLTHSLEVSSVCRSLGTMVGEYICQKYHFDREIRPSDIGSILAAAALAHDIGNPPFGHAGEETIGRFFTEHPIGVGSIDQLPYAQKMDFQSFEGNAQAFRLLTKLQNSDNNGGLQLSLPVLASCVKYPCASDHPISNHVAFRKFNYFQSEKEIFRLFASNIGLKPHEAIDGAWYRHPFSYLLEAADDICYTLVDIEDAYRLNLVDAARVIEFYEAIIMANHIMPDERLDRIARKKDKIEYLRAFAIGLLVDEVVKAFIEYEKEILEGELSKSILEIIPSADALRMIKEYSFKYIYVSQPVLEVGIAGFKVLEVLLESFIGAINCEANGDSTAKTRMLINFLPDQFLGSNRRIDQESYLRNLKVVDFLSGMTDRYAVKVFKMISGVDLPV